jgi:site-specific DNA-methyltransferase (adenine-specific)
MKERKRKIVNEFGMRYNIWKYKTSKNGQEDEIAYKHPAIFPSQLVKDNIISWSNKGDLVYDPFLLND